MDVSRITVDGIKRSTVEAIRLVLFNFANLLETVGLKAFAAWVLELLLLRCRGSSRASCSKWVKSDDEIN